MYAAYVEYRKKQKEAKKNGKFVNLNKNKIMLNYERNRTYFARKLCVWYIENRIVPAI